MNLIDIPSFLFLTTAHYPVILIEQNFVFFNDLLFLNEPCYTFFLPQLIFEFNLLHRVFKAFLQNPFLYHNIMD